MATADPSAPGEPLAAVSHAAREAAAEAGRGGGDAELLAELAARVDSECARPAPVAPTYSLVLLDRLRAAVVEQWLAGGDPPPPGDAAGVLAAFDRVREQLLHPEGALSPLEPLAEFAHDLRSPLTSILFLAGALREGQSGALSDAQRRQVGIIYSAALGMVSLVSNTIELNRGSEGGERSPMSLRGMFESLRDVVAPLAEEKQVEVRLCIPADDHRMGDPVALSRVLLNLAVNALHSTDQGWVELAAEPQGEAAMRFWVRDTGRGIEPEALDPVGGLYRPRPHARGYGFSGTGLGLGICRKLLAQMGGELGVDSNGGQGTAFWFTLHLPPAPPP
ncbi:HAMP domain-containing sensor histidine kinase [Longimicrobium sp.]|uniref:sensor histidine kinase n=1 Tax=Longimicrobium sp. TaxID=2029185 RepID=UPI002C76BA7D|nr:HAMP domain-containing sensor histidine kinase [Longimicrobium sp.]HSU13073.1 HAMP domain-containing sensor histidine kinase [Longimicrobium sp.]